MKKVKKSTKKNIISNNPIIGKNHLHFKNSRGPKHFEQKFQLITTDNTDDFRFEV